MVEYKVTSRPEREPTHPGEILREDVIPALGITVSEFAGRLGVARQTLHRILACKRGITPEMALRIGRLTGNGPGLWLRMQQNYDIWQIEQAKADELAHIRPLAA